MSDSTLTIATSAPELLTQSKQQLAALRDANAVHVQAFMDQTLPNCVKMGLHCLRAYLVFRLNPGKGGRPKKTVTRDGLEHTSFEGWLEAEAGWLKKPTAYKYMAALNGLGLNELSTEEEIDEAIAQHRRVGPLSLKMLCDKHLDEFRPAPEAPRLEQSEFEFIRAGLKAFRQEGDALLAMNDRLRAVPEMHRAACARAYQILHDLTGTYWAPSDEPDTLATIDPDAIVI